MPAETLDHHSTADPDAATNLSVSMENETAQSPNKYRTLKRATARALIDANSIAITPGSMREQVQRQTRSTEAQPGIVQNEALHALSPNGPQAIQAEVPKQPPFATPRQSPGAH